MLLLLPPEYGTVLELEPLWSNIGGEIRFMVMGLGSGVPRLSDRVDIEEDNDISSLVP